MTLNIEEMAAFCKKKGFVYRSSDIYGGFSGFWNLGPNGVELFNKVKQNWWKHFVQDREDIVGMDASIISHPKVWEASGHVSSFGDLILTTKKSKTKLRADHFIEEKLAIVADGLSAGEINNLVKKHNLTYKGEEFEEVKDFNLLFPTKVGAEESNSSIAYLRGETAQAMFTNFRLVADTTRQQLPFGIAQVGKCFRNEISPRDFLFRSREFTIAEFEYFIHPDEKKCSRLTKDQLALELNVLTAKTQEVGKSTLTTLTIKQMLSNKMLNEWHAHLLAEQWKWYIQLGLSEKNLKIREHMKTELSHYSSATFDFDYTFPFGSKEIGGIADRGQFDLNQHIKHSKKKLELFDEATQKKVIPKVIEPTFGMERIFLAVLFEAYHDDKKRENVVLKINKQLAPTYCAIFPLVKNKPEVSKKAQEVYESLRTCYSCVYDVSGTVGRRYARQDELGTPYCITIDFETLEDDAVTIRDRDSTKQERVPIKELRDKLFSLYCS